MSFFGSRYFTNGRLYDIMLARENAHKLEKGAIMSDGYMWDFCVSYVPSDKKSGEWIAGVLRRGHYKVVALTYEQAGWEQFVYALQNSARIIPVLSPSSIDGTCEVIAWEAMCAMDPVGEMRKVVPVTVVPCTPADRLGLVVPIDLTEVAGYAATDFLLTKIGVAVTGVRPQITSEPPFPG